MAGEPGKDGQAVKPVHGWTKNTPKPIHGPATKTPEPVKGKSEPVKGKSELGRDTPVDVKAAKPGKTKS